MILKTLLKQLLDYEEYLNHKVNISFIENNTTKNVNKKLIGLFLINHLYFKGHIFTPLTHSYDFYMESEYMNNCVKIRKNVLMFIIIKNMITIYPYSSILLL